MHEHAYTFTLHILFIIRCRLKVHIPTVSSDQIENTTDSRKDGIRRGIYIYI